MVGEGYYIVKQAIKSEPAAVHVQISHFLDELNNLFGKNDRIDGPNDTRLFSFAVPSQKTNRENQYVAVTTQLHCKGNYPVERGRFRIQVQTKGGRPAKHWAPTKFSNKGRGKEWWEYEPVTKTIGPTILNIVKQARKSMQS